MAQSVEILTLDSFLFLESILKYTKFRVSQTDIDWSFEYDLNVVIQISH